MVLLNLEKSQKVSIIELLALQRVSPSLPASSLSSLNYERQEIQPLSSTALSVWNVALHHED